jgi:hypothetical protein
MLAVEADFIIMAAILLCLATSVQGLLDPGQAKTLV